MVRFLLSQGAPIVVADYRSNTLTISATSRLPPDELASLVAFLLTEGGESIIVSDTHKETALHRAAGDGYEGLAKILLSKGALTMYRDESGWTPLRWAVDRGKIALVRLLRSHDDHPAINGRLGRLRRDASDRQWRDRMVG